MARCAMLLLLPAQLVFAWFLELTEETFDEFIESHEMVMVNFVRGQETQLVELKQAQDILRGTVDYRVPMARVDVVQYPQLSKRYFRGCDHELQLCADSFPRALWFKYGDATPYHRALDTADQLAGFVSALNREPIRTFMNESELQTFSRYLLIRGERSSKLYATLERIAARHMDMLAVAHIEVPESADIVWLVNGSVIETFKGRHDEEQLESWIRGHFAFGEVAPAEPRQEDGSIQVVASTFEDLVLRSDRDVFLIVYAPWCGYSRKALSEWSKFARLTSKSDGLVIAQLDGASNMLDTQEHKVTSFPAFLYFPAGVTIPLRYAGLRTAEALEAFARGQRPTQKESVVMYQPKSRGKLRGSVSRLDGSTLPLRGPERSKEEI